MTLQVAFGDDKSGVYRGIPYNMDDNKSGVYRLLRIDNAGRTTIQQSSNPTISKST
jgi:hypothetical protein